MKADEIKPQKVIRVGVRGRYPRKVLVIMPSVKECETVLQKGGMAQLTNDVFLSRDRTFNQRQEARLFRAQKEKEEREFGGTTRGRGRGAGRGPGRPRGRGGAGRGGGSVRGRGAQSNDSRKRRNSDEEGEVKRQKRDETSRNSNTQSSRDPSETAPAAAVRDSHAASIAEREAEPVF